MIVLEKALSKVYEEIDMVTTPAGDAVAIGALQHLHDGSRRMGETAGRDGNRCGRDDYKTSDLRPVL